MTEHEESRALDVFEEALEAYRRQRCNCSGREAVRAALHAAFIDYEARTKPAERVSRDTRPRPLLVRYRQPIGDICAGHRVDVTVVCSFDRVSPGSSAMVARGVIVGILSDAGMSPRDIAEGLGMSASTVANIKALRRDRPAWETSIAAFAPLFR